MTSRSVTGDYNGSKNAVLISNTKSIYNSLVEAGNHKISMLYVEAHSGTRSINELFAQLLTYVLIHAGNKYNDRVDELAKRGATGDRCVVGRYSETASVTVTHSPNFLHHVV